MSGNSNYCCLDPIPTTTLKEGVDLLPALNSAVNKLIGDSEFPQMFKFPTHIPLLERGIIFKV